MSVKDAKGCTARKNTIADALVEAKKIVRRWSRLESKIGKESERRSSFDVRSGSAG